VVYAKPRFAGPEAVLAYLSRDTHRVAISNRRLIAFDETGVTFRYKNYRRDGADRQQVMTLAPHEFVRRFLLHVLPRGFHRIRHYGLLTGATRKASLEHARKLLAVAPPPDPIEAAEPPDQRPPCPCCGGRMRIIETFERWTPPRAPPHARANRGAVVTRRGLILHAAAMLPRRTTGRTSCIPDRAISGHSTEPATPLYLQSLRTSRHLAQARMHLSAAARAPARA
jgi:hypothetical protein